MEKTPNRKSPLKKNIGIIGKMKKNIDKNTDRFSPSRKRNLIKQGKTEKNLNETDYKVRKNQKVEYYLSTLNFSSRKNIESSDINNEKMITIETDLRKEANIITEIKQKYEIVTNFEKYLNSIDKEKDKDKDKDKKSNVNINPNVANAVYIKKIIKSDKAILMKFLI